MRGAAALAVCSLAACATQSASNGSAAIGNLSQYLPEPVTVAPPGDVRTLSDDELGSVAANLDGDLDIALTCVSLNTLRATGNEVLGNEVTTEAANTAMLQINRSWVARMHMLADAVGMERADVGRRVAIRLRQNEQEAVRSPDTVVLGLAACDAKMRRAFTTEQAYMLYGT